MSMAGAMSTPYLERIRALTVSQPLRASRARCAPIASFRRIRRCGGSRCILPAAAERLVELYQIRAFGRLRLHQLLACLDRLQLNGQEADVGNDSVMIGIRLDLDGPLIGADGLLERG